MQFGRVFCDGFEVRWQGNNRESYPPLFGPPIQEAHLEKCGPKAWRQWARPKRSSWRWRRIPAKLCAWAEPVTAFPTQDSPGWVAFPTASEFPIAPVAIDKHRIVKLGMFTKDSHVFGMGAKVLFKSNSPSFRR